MYRMNHAGFPSHLDSCSVCPSDGWSDNGRHYQIAILHQLERGDPWRSEGGGAGVGRRLRGWTTSTRTRTADADPLLEPGEEGTGGGTYPNTDSYQHGNVRRTGIFLSDFGDVWEVVSFRVSGLGKHFTQVGRIIKRLKNIENA